MTRVFKDYFRELSFESRMPAANDRGDRMLVQRLLARQDDAAFLAIVNRHGGMVYRVCLRILNRPQDAEDAFQATFLALAQNLAKIRKKASLASWLHGVARRVSLQALQQSASRRRRERQVARADAVTSRDDGMPELQVELDHELGRLPEKLRQPLILCCLEGQTLEAAAAQLGWSLSTFRRRLDRARELLSKRLVQRGLMAGATLSAFFLEHNSSLAAPAADLVTATVQTGLTNTPASMVLTGMACQPFAALTVGALPSVGLAKLKSALAIGMFALLLGLASAIVAEAAANAPQLPIGPAASNERNSQRADQSIKPEEPTSQINWDEPSTWAPFHAVAASPNGKVIAAGTNNGQVALWDPATGKLIQELKPLSSSKILLNGIFQETKSAKSVQATVFVGDEKTLAIGCYQGGVEIWTRQPEGNYGLKKILGDQNASVYALALSADGKTLAASCACGWTYLYETRDWKPVGVFFERSNLTSGVAFSRDGSILATAGNTFSVWNLAKNSPLWKARDQREIEEIETATKDSLLWRSGTNAEAGDEVYGADIAISPDSRQIAGVNGTSRHDGGGKCLCSWDSRTGKLQWRALAKDMTSVVFVFGGKRIVTGSTDGTIRLWDAQSGKLLRKSEGHKKAVRNVAPMPQDSTFLSAAEDGTVLLWDAATGKPLQRFLSRR